MVGIVLGILFLGLLAVIIWRAAVYWMDYVEYRRFAKEQDKNEWSKSENPMYIDPHTKYQNPQYKNAKERKKELASLEGTDL